MPSANSLEKAYKPANTINLKFAISPPGSPEGEALSSSSHNAPGPTITAIGESGPKAERNTQVFSYLSPGRLARLATRHPWRVVAAWVVVLVLGVAGASQIGKVLTTVPENYRESDSHTADQLIEDRLLGKQSAVETVVLHSLDRTVDDPGFQAIAERAAAEIRALSNDVANVVTYAETRSESLVSADRHSMLMLVTLRAEATPGGGASTLEVEEATGRVIEVLRKIDGKDGFTAVTAGDGSISRAFSEQAEKDLLKAEAIGLPIALIILAVVFGALVAAGLPVLMAVLSIIVAIGVSALIGQAFELSTFVTNIITTMGLAVGIDYTLIVIQRVREERNRAEAAMKRSSKQEEPPVGPSSSRG